MSASLTIGPDRSGRVLAIDDGRVTDRPVTDAPVLACPDGDIVPGNVCAHTHLYSGLAPYGMPPAMPAPDSFVQILERVWWRLDRALDAESLRASTRDYVANALLAGTTALIDHHESPAMIEGSLAVLADVCEELGIRALLCYGATERNFGTEEAMLGLDECGRIAETSRLRGLVGLHASFTVSDDTIREAGNRARALGTV
ncbi:MAG: amidohydrolase family protein, partial [Rhodospirillales bacterium]|nr:amidohydrolase family protein [Rhodospirillales bacterium]